MKWSWKIGEFAGIGVFIHWTFMLLIGWILVSHIAAGQGIISAMRGVATTGCSGRSAGRPAAEPGRQAAANMQERAFTLHSSRFNSTETRPHFINERCFGEDFASWLKAALADPELAGSEPIQEDWGWCLVASTGASKFTISVGIMDESIGQIPAEWRVGVAYERPMNGLRGLFKPVPHSQLESIAKRLQAVLATAAEEGRVLPA